MDAAARQFVELAARRGWVRHALKTALACCVAVVAALLIPLGFAVLLPVFVFLLMTFCMPDLARNWFQTLPMIAVHWVVCGFIITVFGDSHLLFLITMLSWVFVFMWLVNWYPIPATLGTMMPAIATFQCVLESSTAGLQFLTNYIENWLVAGGITISVQYLIWPRNVQRLAFHRLAVIHANLEFACLQLSRSLEAPAAAQANRTEGTDWNDFVSLRHVLRPNPELAPVLENLLVRMARRCQAQSLRLEFLRQTVARDRRALPESIRTHVSEVLRYAAEQFRLLSQAALTPAPIEPAPRRFTEDLIAFAERSHEFAEELIPRVVQYLIIDLNVIIALHNAVVHSVSGAPVAYEIPLPRACSAVPLVNAEALRRSTKMVILMLVLLGIETYVGAPGGMQLAFFGTFFAGVANLGKQSRVALVGMVGLSAALVYAILAAAVTVNEPYLAVVLGFVALGMFSAAYFFFAVPRYNVAGMQAGLVLAYAYLAGPGPEWGTFGGARTRLGALIVAGLTAFAIHALFWPVLPMRRARGLLATALRDSASYLKSLFANRAAAAPPDLTAVVADAAELLEDARYLGGPSEAPSHFRELFIDLHEIDANLEYLNHVLMLVSDEESNARFFSKLQPDVQRLCALLETLAHWKPAERAPIPGKNLVAAEAFLGESLNARIVFDDRARYQAIARSLDNISAVAAGMSLKIAGLNRDG